MFIDDAEKLLYIFVWLLSCYLQYYLDRKIGHNLSAIVSLTYLFFFRVEIS